MYHKPSPSPAWRLFNLSQILYYVPAFAGKLWHHRCISTRKPPWATLTASSLVIPLPPGLFALLQCFSESLQWLRNDLSFLRLTSSSLLMSALAVATWLWLIPLVVFAVLCFWLMAWLLWSSFADKMCSIPHSCFIAGYCQMTPSYQIPGVCVDTNLRDPSLCLCMLAKLFHLVQSMWLFIHNPRPESLRSRLFAKNKNPLATLSWVITVSDLLRIFSCLLVNLVTIGD